VQSAEENELEVVLEEMDEDAVLEFLLNADGPVFESVLIRLAWPPADDPSFVYTRHFALYHRLASWQARFHREGKYLHMDCMRIRLLPYPHPGTCRYYDDRNGSFCASLALPGVNACSRHQGMVDGIFLAPLAGYYLEKEHHAADRSAVLARYQGAGPLTELLAAYNDLGVSPDAEWQTVRKQYHDMVFLCHPDTGSGDAERLARIQAAWRRISKAHEARRVE